MIQSREKRKEKEGRHQGQKYIHQCIQSMSSSENQNITGNNKKKNDYLVKNAKVS